MANPGNGKREKTVVTLHGVDKALFTEMRVYALKSGTTLGTALNAAMKKFLEK